jgi:MoaA/NifB/PqqE/SkfB family radical SAM enzyme
MSNPVIEKPRMPQPERVTIQVNYSCNQSCLHCYQKAGPHLVGKDREAVQDFVPVIRHLYNLGFRELKIMGGEPLLYQGLIELLEEARRCGLTTSLITGGSAGDRRTWERMAGLVDTVWFSIYHTDPEIHDHLVQRKGALEALWRNSEALEGGIKRGFHLLLNRLLLHDLEPTLSILCRKGADAIKILWPSPDGAAVENWSLYSIQPQEWPWIASVAVHVGGLFPTVKIALARHALEEGGGFTADPKSACSYGDRKLWGVDPKGLLYPCCLLMEHEDYAIGPAGELTIEEIEQRVMALAERDRVKRLGPLSECGTCPALLTESGEDRRAVPGWRPVCPLVQVGIDR